MSYLDLLPSDLVGLLDVFVCHGCKVVLFPFTIEIYQDAKWLQIIKENISEDVIYRRASDYLYKGFRYILGDDSYIQRGTNLYIRTGKVVYTFCTQASQNVHLLFFDFYYQYTRREILGI